ncbi:hypothetical protein Y032_0071g578 [Ancylostoma ceylanicum]|nr:hypothetical protein Y032_0071g578 [Ancylostoma ceylanicum]
MLESDAGAVEMYGLSISRVMTLVKECLSCNIFKWSGKYFSQIRGLAMGQRLAPVIAICFMSKIEAPVLARLPLMYCRYIDDCCIVTSTQSEMDECFSILNQQSEHISFTRETPKDGWLAFLNTQVNLSNNTIRVKWYRKASSKNILIHATSAHPSSVKRAIVRNMFRTASQVCSDDHQREESLRLASSIARENGYSLCRRRTPHSGYFHGLKGKKKLSLCLPFISDDISTEIRRCLARAQLQNDVTLVNIPNGNLKKQLVRNRLYDSEQCISNECVVCPYGKTGDCSKTGVIYQIKCLSCDALYIGETGRILSTRVKEHLASKRRRSLISALGRHRQDDHLGEDFDVACTILAQETSSKNILIHATSAHPSSVKRAIVRNMFRTASQVCSDDHQREESLRLASSIARENGYSLCRRRTPHSGYFHGLKGKKKLSLCLPFISDDISTEIRRCLARAQLQNDVTLVNIPNGNLKKQLVRNRLYDSEQCISNECVVCPFGKTGDCSKTGVVYQIKCLSCDALYIGETGRILSTRVKEHLASKRRRSLISALGRHRRDDHGGEDFDVACTILAQETEITARKTMEAFWISVRNPKMNNRNECLAITNELLPFVSLCDLQMRI